jgi:myosin-crossreactive antigen
MMRHTAQSLDRGGIASLAAAAFLIREGDVAGTDIACDSN